MRTDIVLVLAGVAPVAVAPTRLLIPTTSMIVVGVTASAIIAVIDRRRG